MRWCISITTFLIDKTIIRSYNVRMTTITTTLTTAGNSTAVRLPKELLRMSRLSNTVELEAKNGQIIIRNIKNPRAGWRKLIQQDLQAHGSLNDVDDYGSLADERNNTLVDGLSRK